MSKRKSTMKELIFELEKLSPNQLKDRMIQSAKEGDFHDYKSKYICGKMFFIRCSEWFKNNIIKIEAGDIAEYEIEKMNKMESDIKNGEYDEVADKEDRAMMASWIDEDSSNPERNRKLKELLKL